MKFFCVLCSLFLAFSMHGQNVDLPPNPKPGHCYIRCMEQGEKMTKWKDVDCAIVDKQSFVLEMDNDVLSKKDKRTLDKIVKPFIKQGLTMELIGYYKIDAADAKNQEAYKNKLIEVGNYFVEQGFEARLLKSKIQAAESEVENKFSYRAVSVSTEPCCKENKF